MTFTFDEVRILARKELDKINPDLGLCLDKQKEAMTKPTVKSAAEILVDDSLYWAGHYC